jgi:hypothetical protein
MKYLPGRALWRFARYALLLAVTSGVSAVAWGDALTPPPELANSGFESPDARGFASAWHPRNWGPASAGGECVLEEGSARTGARCLRLASQNPEARPGASCQATFRPGRYALSVWAKAEPGHAAFVRLYMADEYSPMLAVSEEWTQLTYRHTITRPRLMAQVRIQLLGAGGGTVRVDDASLEALPPLVARVSADQRPADQQPRALYDGANLNYLREHAAAWAGRGLAGFLIPDLMHSASSSVWGEDGDAATTGEDDRLFQEARNAVRECRTAGLTENAMRVSVLAPLPDPYDDAAYARWVGNFQEGARFARDAGLRMLVLDTEYCAAQYSYDWKGYALQQHSREELARQTWERWREIGRVIGQTAPALDLGIMPEGALYYGPLWLQTFSGLLEGLSLGGSKGQVHLFCEGTFSLTQPEAIAEHAAAVRALMQASLSGEALRVWQKRGGLALGAWPLGYYRPVLDSGGQMKGWSGKRETFGDRVVGAFADKSERYSLDEFRTQWAAIRTYSDGYCWIYGHGSSWWQVTAEQADRYAPKIHRFPRENYLVPTVPSISAWYQALAERDVVELKEE